MLRGFVAAVVVLLAAPALAGDWGPWEPVEAGISWRTKCNRGEWLMEFRSERAERVCLTYEIQDGYGGQGVDLAPGGRKSTYANYRNPGLEAGCAGMIWIRTRVKEGRCY